MLDSTKPLKELIEEIKPIINMFSINMDIEDSEES